MSALPDKLVAGIKARRDVTTPWLIGYVTRGGTYVIASNGATTDSGGHRDLVAILPGDLGHGRVLALSITTNPEMIPVIEEILAQE